jgi:large subunit ribosomal protein L24
MLMKRTFSTHWLSSKQPRKQRKFRMNAPLHTRGKFLTSMLSKPLAEKYKINRTRIRVGDKVKVMVGKYKGTEGKVDFIDIKKSRVKITGIEVSKKDGSKAKAPIHASNLMIVDLSLEDKKRLGSAKQ